MMRIYIQITKTRPEGTPILSARAKTINHGLRHAIVAPRPDVIIGLVIA